MTHAKRAFQRLHDFVEVMSITAVVATFCLAMTVALVVWTFKVMVQ